MGKNRLKKRHDEAGPRIKAHSSSSISTEQLSPIFSLHLMGGDKYSLANCEVNDKAHFADALYKRARLTWADLRRAQAHGLGFETIPRHRIKATIPSAVTDDVNSFVVFRCIAEAPMVGYRDGAIFHVLWIDRDFTLYNHG
jgi:hypothetical protein